jgi:dehydrogenase/reductase SDR family protein 12
MGSGFSLVATAQWYKLGNRTFGRAGYEAASARWPAEPPLPAGRTCIVTGANAGLGFAAAKLLLAARSHVHIVCRNKERGEAALAALRAGAPEGASVELHVADVASAASVRAFAAAWLARGQPLHALVLNAGVLPQTLSVTEEGLEAGWATALRQSYLLAGLLVPALLRGGEAPGAGFARVIHVTSGGGLTVPLSVARLAPPPAAKFNGTLQYALAKRAQMVLAKGWAERLRGAGVWAASAHPGWADTEGVRDALADFAKAREGKLRTPEQGADTIAWLALSTRVAEAQRGELFFDREPAAQHLSSWAGTDAGPAEEAKLWAAAAQQCGWAWEGSAEEAAAAAAKAAKAAAAKA